MAKVFIIAEAGVNHNGSLEIAKKLVDVAVNAGADAVKFQTFMADRLVTAVASRAEYQIVNTGTNESQLEMLEKLELSPEMHRELFSYCKRSKIIFMSTPFDEPSVDLLDNLGMQIFKISSGEITNKPLLQHIASKKKPIILSTGMSFIGEVEKAIGWINEIWNKLNINPKLTLLHCVSDYPANVEDSNLAAMKTMEVAFRLTVGYSDHSCGLEIPIAAIALGAKVIEKHITLDRNMQGPDHMASVEPYELESMVNAIRNVEKAMGDGIKKPVNSEISTKKIVRRSLVATRDIKAGETILSDDILIKRPGTGIPAEFKDKIVGMQLESDISIDSVIKWEDLKHA